MEIENFPAIDLIAIAGRKVQHVAVEKSRLPCLFFPSQQLPRFEDFIVNVRVDFFDL
jgi:hypothetical protein